MYYRIVGRSYRTYHLQLLTTFNPQSYITAMRVYTPTHPSQIRLQQYVDFKTAANEVDKCIVASGCTRKQVMGFTPQTIEVINGQFQDAADKAPREVIRHIKLRKMIRSVRLSFIPNLESMTLAEHVDMDELSRLVFRDGKFEHLPKLMAILYRPMTARLGKWYRLQEYDSEKNAHEPYIGMMTMEQVNSALLFFSTIRNELLRNLNESLEVEAKKILKKKV